MTRYTTTISERLKTIKLLSPPLVMHTPKSYVCKVATSFTQIIATVFIASCIVVITNITRLKIPVNSQSQIDKTPHTISGKTKAPIDIIHTLHSFTTIISAYETIPICIFANLFPVISASIACPDSCSVNCKKSDETGQ